MHARPPQNSSRSTGRSGTPRPGGGTPRPARRGTPRHGHQDTPRPSEMVLAHRPSGLATVVEPAGALAAAAGVVAAGALASAGAVLHAGALAGTRWRQIEGGASLAAGGGAGLPTGLLPEREERPRRLTHARPPPSRERLPEAHMVAV